MGRQSSSRAGLLDGSSSISSTTELQLSRGSILCSSYEHEYSLFVFGFFCSWEFLARVKFK